MRVDEYKNRWYVFLEWEYVDAEIPSSYKMINCKSYVMCEKEKSMITIALDEYGQFEKVGNNGNAGNKQLVFIAGLVYDDKGCKNDAENEKKRLDIFFKRVAKSLGCIYPEDLHLNRERDNYNRIAEFERALEAALPEFLEKGYFNGKPVDNVKREGYYRFVMMLKSERGKSKLNEKGTSRIIGDGYASNLYMNMAYSTVSRLVLHNPLDLEINKVNFELATRITMVPNNDKETKIAYERLGFKKDEEKSNDKETAYQVANESNYRAAILRKVSELKRYDLQVENLSVNSINYNVRGKATEKYVFLYLSDMLCSIFQHNKSGKTFAEIQQSFIKKANELLPSKEHLFFAYDDIDDILEEAIKAYQEKDYYQTLALLFKSKGIKSTFKEFYWKQWFPMVEQWIKEATDRDSIETAILQFSRYSRSNLLQQDELVYLYDKLEPLVQKLDETNSHKYKFYDAGITAYNHIGDSKTAEACFEKCKEYLMYTHVEDYLETLNRRVVMLNDQYRYEEALETVDEALLYHDELCNLRSMLFSGKSVPNIGKGRTLSQKGQVLSYMRNPEAESSFTQALDEFDTHSADGSGYSMDYYITLSYLLHHYIDMGNRESYEEYAPRFFGGKQAVMDQYAYLQHMTEEEEKNQSYKFAFYVFIKALYTFYVDDIKGDGRRTLMKWAANPKDSAKAKHLNGHPWELIYKYFALLSIQWDKPDYTEGFVERMQTIVDQKDAAIENIITGGLVEYYTAIGDTTAAEAAKHRFTECYTAKEDPTEAEKEKNKLKTDYEKWLVYMFR